MVIFFTFRVKEISHENFFVFGLESKFDGGSRQFGTGGDKGGKTMIFLERLMRYPMRNFIGPRSSYSGSKSDCEMYFCL